jgi:hypothetical protein
MRRRVAAGVVVLGSVLGCLALTGCGSEPTCDDLESLAEQVAEADPEDPEFNDLVNRLNQAQADCNAG